MTISKHTDILIIGSGLSGAMAATLESRESRGTHYLLEDTE